MLYITGDTHGDQNKWMAEIHPILQPGDTIIIAGDFGVGFWNGPQGSEEQFFDWLQNQPYTVLFCDGNHCNFEKLEKYPVEGWNGGRVHVLRSNLLHLMRGELYTIGQKSVFAFGGGYSLDKYRRVEGVSWWPQEMPSAQEYENAKRNLKQHENRVDIIVTHTAPAASVYFLSTLYRFGIKGNVIEEFPLTAFLDQICASVSYDRWFFGHFHIDFELWKNQTAVFNTIRNLETGEIVHRWESYESF